MSEELIDRVRGGLEAWQRGDVEALAPLLHPDVELSWWEPGEWDCHGREAVLELLRQRVATLIRFRDGLAIERRQFRDRAEALAAA
jgi:ketosteroid isomerase-like protein